MNTKASVMFKLFFALIVVFLFSIVLINGISAEKTDKIDKTNKIVPAVVKDSGMIDVTIIFKSETEKGLKTSEISTLASKGMQIKKELPLINGAHVIIPRAQLESLRNSPLVEMVEINERKIHVLLNTALPIINGAAAQNLGYNGSGVNVCIIDSGIDFWHKNLPAPVASADFTDWDWCIDGRQPTSGIIRSYNYSINITNPSLDWLEVGLNWINITNRYDITVYYPNGTHVNNTTTLSAFNDSNGQWIKLNLTTTNGNNGSWIVAVNETDINNLSDFPTLFWGSNIADLYSYYENSGYSCDGLCSSCTTPVGPDTRTFYNIQTQDDYGHGTHVAGIIASNNTTYKGVAPNVTLLIAKVCDSQGTCDYLSDAIQWCVENNASIISMSLGGTDTNCGSTSVVAVDNAAINSNVLSVTSAGNCGLGGSSDPVICPTLGSTTITFPGCAKTAITVGATRDDDVIATFSSMGPTSGTALKRVKPDITAPGVDIYSTCITNTFVSKQGTSMATPFVSGVAALLKQQNPNLTASDIKAILMASSNKTNRYYYGSPISDFDPDNTYGTGRVDALKAVNGTFVKTINMTGGQSISYKINVTNSSTGLFVAANWNENTSSTHYIVMLNLTYPNSSVADTSTNPNNTIQQVGKFSPSAGVWTITIKNVNNTNRTVSIASTYQFYQPPEVYLISPVNNNTTNTTVVNTVTFLYKVKDSLSNISNCQLYGNFTGTWQANQSNLTTIVNYAVNNTTTNNFTVSNLSDGAYIWNVYCNNTDGAIGFNSTNYTLKMDVLPPIITINSPINNYNTSKNITLNWSISDVSNTSLKYSINKTTNSTLYSNKTGVINITVGAGLNQNITIYVNDSFSKTNSTTVIFNIDRTAPNLTVLYPQNGTQTNTTSIDINYTASDNLQLSKVWYKLENGTAVDITSGNSSINLTFPGNYTLEVYANDSVGNINHTIFLFSTIFNMNMTNWTQNLLAAAPEIKMINVTFNGLDVTYNDSTPIDGNMTIFVNTSNFNITFTNFTGLGANWMDKFNVTETNSTINNTISNMGSNAIKLIYISNANEFLSDEEYNGTITFLGNSSNYNEFFYCENSSYCNKLNTCSSSPACYIESATTTTIYVPHFSAVVAANDTSAPRITVNSPTNTTYGHPSTAYALKANLTTSADAIYCNMSLMANGSFTKPSDSKTNQSNFTNGNTSYVWTIGPLHNGTYNITFSCNDSSKHTNTTTKYFTINDATKPSFSNVETTTEGVNYARITWYANEFVNTTIKYGDDIDQLDTSIPDSGYLTSSIIQISNLNDKTEYFYNLTGCDYAGNCNTTGPYNFTTAENTTESANEGGEGAGGGTENQTNTTSLIKIWAAIEAYGKNTMTISSSSIPLAKVSFILNANAQNGQLTVNSLGNTLPYGLTNLPAPVYKYFSITASISIRNSMTLATIVAKIPKSYISSNNYNYSTVTLYNNGGTNWEKLNTVLIDTTGDYYSYEANTTHFSTFAITMAPNIETYTPPNQTLNQTQNQTTITNTTNQTSGIGIGYEQPPDYTMPIVIAIIVAAVAAILIFLYKKGIIFSRSDYYTQTKRPIIPQKQVYKPKNIKKIQQEQGLFDGLKKGPQKQDDGPELFRLK